MSNCTLCNYVVGSPNLITGKVKYLQYGYELNNLSTEVFLGLFAAITILHILLAVYWRKWSGLFTIALGGALEAVGWGGRHWSYKTITWDPTQGGGWTGKKQAFLLQIILLVCAPTLFSAANYILLGTIVRKTNRGFSSITASSFSKMFTATDILCLIIQALGGALTGKASTSKQLKVGLHVTAVGIIAQIVVTIFFLVLFAEFHYRMKSRKTTNKQYDLLAWAKCCRTSRKSHPSHQSQNQNHLTSNDDKSMHTTTLVTEMSPPAFARADISSSRLMLVEIGMIISTILIIARSIYRAVEMLTFNYGAQSGVYYDQTTFIALDGALMLALVFFWLFFHPGMFDGKKLF